MVKITNVIDIENQEQLDDLIAIGKPIVIDFHALSWCQPCKRLHPHFVKAAEQHDNSVFFVTVDVDKAGWATTEYGVMSVPTVKMIDSNGIRDIKGRTVLQLVSEID